MMADSDFSLSTLHAKLAAEKDAGRLLLLSSSDVIKALNAFLAGDMSKKEIAAWAEFYDANDGVEFEDDEAISGVIFNISSPEINGWLDDERARNLLSKLNASRNFRRIIK